MVLPEKRVQSPCIRHCCLNDDDVCLGCFRSLAEIVGWADSSNSIRQEVLEKADARRLAHEEKYHKFYR